MATVLAVTGTLVLVTFLVATPVARHREADRRRRRVVRRRTAVNLGDVRRRLAEELPAHHLPAVHAGIDRHRLEAPAVWAYLDRHGASALLELLTAGHRHTTVVRRLSDLDGPGGRP